MDNRKLAQAPDRARAARDAMEMTVANLKRRVEALEESREGREWLLVDVQGDVARLDFYLGLDKSVLLRRLHSMNLLGSAHPHVGDWRVSKADGEEIKNAHIELSRAGVSSGDMLHVFPVAAR